QNQRALCAQTTKIDRLDAGATFDHETTELAVDLRGARSGGCRLHETGHIEETGRFVRLDRDDLHRRRRLIFWAFQQRSRNGYCLQCLWFFFLLLLLRRSIRLRSCGLILRLLGRRIVWLCICRASHEKAGADGGSQKLAIHQEYSPWCCDLLVDTHLHVSTKDGRKFRGTRNAQFPDSENAMSLTPRSHYPQINIFATFAKDFGKGMYCVKLRADPSPCQARRDASPCGQVLAPEVKVLHDVFRRTARRSTMEVLACICARLSCSKAPTNTARAGSLRGIPPMRKLAVASLLVVPLLLAGCGASNEPGGASSAATSTTSAGTPASAATAVTGTVTVENPPSAITPQATLELSLVDVTQQPGVTVNKQDFNPPKFPQAFRIAFSPSAINANDLYVLKATMQDNGRSYSTKLQQPVLTHGQSANVNLTLVAEPTAAEKMLADFESAKRQTGGMKVKSGTSSKIGESHSWQVFSDV